MLRRVVSISVLALTVGCGIFGGKGGSGGGDDAPPPETGSGGTKEVSTTESEGAVTGAFAKGSTDTQVMNASASSAIAGSSVAFPPGALAVDVSVTMEQGVTLGSASLESTLGVNAGTLSEAGPAVVITSDPKTNAVTPFNVSLTVTQAAGLLGGTYVVVFKSYDADTGNLTVGVIPTVTTGGDGKTITFSTKKFGAFQAFLTTEVIAAVIEKATTDPIKTTREEKKEGTVEDKTAPALASSDIPDPSIPAITQNQSFSLKFNEAIDASKAKVTGSVVGSGNVLVTAPSKDTLLIAPATSWVLGKGDFKVEISDLAGNALATPVTFSTEVVSKIFHVHPSGTSVAAGATGAKNQPMNSVREAAAEAAKVSAPTMIFVAKGTYVGVVELVKGGRLFGGFPDEKFQVRAPAANETILEGDTAQNSYSVVLGTEGNESSTVDEALIDGFTINSDPDTTDAKVVDLYDLAFPTKIRFNKVNAKGVSGAQGIVVYQSPVEIVGNRITGTAVDATSMIYNTGIEISDNATGTAKSAVIAHNYIKTADVTYTGSSYPSQGVAVFGLMSDAGLTLHDNVIIAGNRVGPGPVKGLAIASSKAEIRNNSILAGSANSGISTVLVLVGSATPDVAVDNNALMTLSGTVGTFGVEYSGEASLTSFRNNAFRLVPPPNFLRGGLSLTEIKDTTLTSFQAADPTKRKDNLSDRDLGFTNVQAGDLHPLANSELKGNGLEGNAENPVWNFGGAYVDLDQVARGANWSIGAYQ